MNLLLIETVHDDAFIFIVNWTVLFNHNDGVCIYGTKCHFFSSLLMLETIMGPSWDEVVISGT